MSHKQIFLTFERVLIEEVKERCAMKEKRSVTSLLRKLFSDLPADPGQLLKLGQRLSKEQSDRPLTDPVNIAVRFPEDEYWDAKAKASHAHMTLKEFSSGILRLWVRGELDESLNQNRARRMAGP